MTDRLSCPCCGYQTLPERDAYELCPVCFWEDDPSESRAPGFSGGANALDLLTAQRTFLRIGAVHPIFVANVRATLPTEARASDWHPYLRTHLTE
ncbi:CPCC family cysteine-rich protein [Terrabacter aerolatus]|uniref:CPCC family cysteine-rich protein n=1 Tax=Terrabacter aerolatus TaxID=422442 RepID=UPI0011BDA457|nr:CPCC family cysteine-rich protein [Terrabacter aerolatus]